MIREFQLRQRADRNRNIAQIESLKILLARVRDEMRSWTVEDDKLLAEIELALEPLPTEDRRQSRRKYPPPW